MCSLSIARDLKSPHFLLPSVLLIVLPISPSFVLPSPLFSSCRALARHPSLALGMASLNSFRTALRDVIPRHASLFVIPRHVSAEGSLASHRATASHRVIPRHVSAEGSLTLRLKTTPEELAQKHFHFSPLLWLTKGGIGLKF